MDQETLETLVRRANTGDQESLEKIVLTIKDYVYNLSLKMLLFPEDAKDATQEILVKVITHLSTFNHKSKFSTWVYRIATNYLLTQKQKKAKEFPMPFADYEVLIDSGHSDRVSYASNDGELKLLEEEVKVSCTQGLLLCLKPIDRIIYILSDILEFNSKEGAAIVNITPENFRKKLSRSRMKIRNFLKKKCGLVNSNNPCRCVKKIDFLVDQNIIEPNRLRFAELSKRSIDLIEKIDQVEKSIAVYRSVPSFTAPDIIFKNIKAILSHE
ncbi:RNA polymerase sigma factor [uncultured Aquimarina sp.]|uniref:RNA polymerase sigma factor n=1 Tax=uncultured Aquimarina sp. TaxID=575652 RepID=UPI00260E97B7|nr:RNA polymerase sigma factor [uncultured Aquimarina sp.]